MTTRTSMPTLRQIKLALAAIVSLWAIFAPAYKAQKKPQFVAVKKVDDAILRQADSRPGDWITHGRTYSEARYSPLKRIDAANVQRLGLAWSFDTETNRG